MIVSRSSCRLRASPVVPADVRALGGTGGDPCHSLGGCLHLLAMTKYNDKLIIMQASFVQCIRMEFASKEKSVNQLLSGYCPVLLTTQRLTLLGSFGLGRRSLYMQC